MENFKKTEFLILAALWVCAIATYPYALLTDYNLFTSDYLGIIGLTLSTAYSFNKPDKALGAVILLLSFGLLNLISFAYFINLVFTFGFSIFVTPGIQLISLTLLIILTLKKRDRVIEAYRNNFSKSEEEKQADKSSLKIRFKTKFYTLSDNEIAARLKNDLVPEAKEALLEIIDERKSALQQ